MEPPRPFVESLLKEMGFLGFHDLRWFSRDEIRLDTMETWLPDLESYYLPCKATRFLHIWSDVTPITVLRHILHSHGYDLQKEERLYKGGQDYAVSNPTETFASRFEWSDSTGGFHLTAARNK